jgi:nitrogen fixation NifU-like protein
MTTELVKGKSLEEAANLSRDDINEALGKLPAPKYHCSILAADGINKAIQDYKSKNKK